MSWTRRLEDYTIVTLITLLIWLYAESRTLEPYGPVSLALELRAPGDDHAVLAPSTPNVRVEFIGANSAISKLKSNLSGKLVVPLEAMEPGQHTLPLADLLPQSAQLAGASVNITSVEPPTVSFTVARLVTRDVELVWTPENLQLQEGYKADPAKVKLTLPEELAQQVGMEGKITLPVQLREDPRKLQAGVEKSAKADVVLPPTLANNPYVKLSASETTLSFIIEKKEDSYIVESVPVFFSSPPGEQRNFVIELHEEDRLLKDVEVTGPTEWVEKVKKGTEPIVAQFQLTRDELIAGVQKGEKSYPVTFSNLPPGLSVKSPKTAVRATISRVEP